MRRKADGPFVVHAQNALFVRLFPVRTHEGDEIQPRSVQARELGFGGIGNEDEAGQIVRKSLDKLCGNGRILVFRRIGSLPDNQPILAAQDCFFLHDFFHQPFLSIACSADRTSCCGSSADHRLSAAGSSQAPTPPQQAPASSHTRRSPPSFQYIRRFQEPRQRDRRCMQPAAGRTASKRDEAFSRTRGWQAR